MSAAVAKAQSFVKSRPSSLILGLVSILVGVTSSAESTYYDAFYILLGLFAVGHTWLRWRDDGSKNPALSYVTFGISAATAFGVLAYFSRTAVPFLAGLCVIACLVILAGVGYRSFRR